MKSALAVAFVAFMMVTGIPEAQGLALIASEPTDLFTLAPCRVIDTRAPAGPLGGPALVAGADRVFPVAGICGIPPTAKAISVNIAVTGATAPGNLRLHPGGSAVPLISSINYSAGDTRSNNVIVSPNALGEVAAFVGAAGGTVHLVLDVNGYFAPPCTERPSANVGCEFYAVTLPNPQLLQSSFGFALAIVNSSLTNATVSVSKGAVVVTTVIVAPSGTYIITLPWVTSLSTSDFTTRADGAAYRVQSDVPVAAYQFNPYAFQIGAQFSATNDASMLLPVKALTGNYRTAAWPTGAAGTSHFAMVGTENGTTVTVTDTSVLSPGSGLTATGGVVTLDRGDVLLATATFTTGADVSGAQIVADKPIAVFGGHGCANAPEGAGYCDHLEEQLPPLELLGDEYVVPVPFNSTGTPKHFVKIQGTAAGTALTMDPPVVSGVVLGAGGTFLFETTSAVRITATAPIVVTHFLEGSTRYGDFLLSGDPSMSVATPTRQFRTRYEFLAAPNYTQNWVTVMAATGASISIDGVAIPVGSFTAVGSSGFSVARVGVCAGNAVGCDGSHTALGDRPFGILVHGYGQYTSYMYPGGMGVSK